MRQGHDLREHPDTQLPPQDPQARLRNPGSPPPGPAASIILMVVAFNFVGDGVRDAFDPRLRNLR